MGATPPQHRSVLIVEDDADIREALVDALATEGYETEAVVNGAEATHYLQRATTLPSLIILDLMMPVKDGYTFYAEQRQHPTWSEIPVLVLSADPEAGRHIALAGASALLRKPVDLDVLLQAVAQLTQRAA